MTEEERADDSVAGRVEAILAGDIPDPARRRMIARMIAAEVRTRTVHALRESFDPYIGMDGTPPSPEEAVAAMREAVISASGFHPAR
jgi:hypothetical protein